MAFTEAQILAAGGVQNNKAVPKSHRANPSPSVSTSSNPPAASYSNSVASENTSAFASSLSNVRWNGESWNFGGSVKMVFQNDDYEDYVYGSPVASFLNQSLAQSWALNEENNLPLKQAGSSSLLLMTPPTSPKGMADNSYNTQETLKMTDMFSTANNILSPVSVLYGKLQPERNYISSLENLYNSNPAYSPGLLETINSNITQYNMDLTAFNSSLSTADTKLANLFGGNFLLGEHKNPVNEYNAIMSYAGSSNDPFTQFSFEMPMPKSNGGSVITTSASAWALPNAIISSEMGNATQSTNTGTNKSIGSWLFSDLTSGLSILSNPKTYSTIGSDAFSLFKAELNPNSYITAYKDYNGIMNNVKSGITDIYDWSISPSTTNFFDNTIPSDTTGAFHTIINSSKTGLTDIYNIGKNPNTYKTTGNDIFTGIRDIGLTAINPNNYITGFNDIKNGMKSFGNDLNKPFDFAGFSTPHAYNLFELSTPLTALNGFNNIDFNPTKFNSFVSKNQKTLEFGGLIALDIGATIVTAGSADAILGPVTAATYGMLFGTDIGASFAESAVTGAASFAVGNTIFTEGSSLINTGKNATNKQLLTSAMQGALFGAVAAPVAEIGLNYLKLGYGTLTGLDVIRLKSLASFYDEFGMTSDVLDIGQTYSSLAQKGADMDTFDFNKVFFGTNKNDEVVFRYYNDVNMGYGSSSQLKNYLTDIVDRTGEPLNFGTAAQTDFTTQQTIKSLQDLNGGLGLGGVREAANPNFEGMYFNVPTYQNNPIFLNYLGLKSGGIGSESIMKFSLNPFAAKGTFFTGGIDIEDMQFKTIGDFFSDTNYKGSINSIEGERALSTYLGRSAVEDQAQMFMPYQNVVANGGQEIQAMATVGDIFSGAGSKTMFIDYDEGILPFVPKVSFGRIGIGSVIGFSEPTIEEIGKPSEIFNPASQSIRTIDLSSPMTSSALFFSGSSLVDPIISGNASNLNGFASIHPSNVNISPSSSGLIEMPSVFSGFSTSLSGSEFLSGISSSIPSKINSASSKSSLYKSFSSLAGSYMDELSSAMSDSMSSFASSSFANDSIGSSLSSMKFDNSDWWKENTLFPIIPFGFSSGGRKADNLDWTSSKYMPSLGAAVFGLKASKKRLKKQNAGGGLRNSFFRPIIE